MLDYFVDEKNKYKYKYTYSHDDLQLYNVQQPARQRQLQTSSLAVKPDDGMSSLLFPYTIFAFACLAVGYVLFRLAYNWYFGIEDEPDEPPLTGDEILAQLTEEQRREIVKDILGQFCKAATVSDVSHSMLCKHHEQIDIDDANKEIEQAFQVEEGKEKNPGIVLATAKVPEGTVDVNEEKDDGKCPELEMKNDHYQKKITSDIEEGIVDTGGVDHLAQHSKPSEMPSSSSLDDASNSTHNTISTLEHVCPICLGDYEKGTMLFTSRNCKHIFHGDCILEWLTKHDECPICREKIVTQEEMVAAALALIGKTASGNNVGASGTDAAI